MTNQRRLHKHYTCAEIDTALQVSQTLMAAGGRQEEWPQIR